MRIFFSALLFCFLTAPVYADRVGYATLPLTVPVRTWELRGFSTVGGVADYMLSRVGYSLLLDQHAPEKARWVSSQPINPAIFVHDVLSIEDILLAAIGSKHRLIIDVKHRLVSFDVMPSPVIRAQSLNTRFYTGDTTGFGQ